jgi:hypothetical protein
MNIVLMRLTEYKSGVRLSASGLGVLRSGRQKPEAGRRFDSYAD